MSRVGDPARLEARVARKSFRTASGRSVPVLANLSFALEEGETGALIGPSGCGKSTLMRILAGLDRDFEGSVDIPTHGRVGMRFQEPQLAAVAQRRGQRASCRARRKRSRGRGLVRRARPLRSPDAFSGRTFGRPGAAHSAGARVRRSPDLAAARRALRFARRAARSAVAARSGEARREPWYDYRARHPRHRRGDCSRRWNSSYSPRAPRVWWARSKS